MTKKQSLLEIEKELSVRGLQIMPYDMGALHEVEYFDALVPIWDEVLADDNGKKLVKGTYFPESTSDFLGNEKFEAFDSISLFKSKSLFEDYFKNEEGIVVFPGTSIDLSNGYIIYFSEYFSMRKTIDEALNSNGGEKAVIPNGRISLSDILSIEVAYAIWKDILGNEKGNSFIEGINFPTVDQFEAEQFSKAENIEIFSSKSRFDKWFFDEKIDRDELFGTSVKDLLAMLARDEVTLDTDLAEIVSSHPADAVTLSNGYIAFFS